MRNCVSTIVTASVFLGGLLSGNPESTAAQTSRPNVVVIMTDDQGYGDLSCHGNPVLKTPHLDQLYAQSIRFTDFHVAPMCTPTRGQLLSGVDCLRNGAMNVSSGRVFLRREYPTMADWFRHSGYRCGQFGKWHLGDNFPYRPQDRGFHEAVYYPSSHIGSAPDFFTNHYFDDTYWHHGQRESYRGYTTDVFFEQAMRWMGEQAANQQPFFCYLPTAAAHGPLFVPESYRQRFADLRLHGLGPRQVESIRRFFAMIANIDDNVGRLEEFLVTRQLRENTIVIFLTDNGGTGGVPVFNAGMKGGKVTLWEGGHRVPCFVRWPSGDLRPPGDIPELATVQDILPTLIDLCGLSQHPNSRLDGQSWAKILRGESETLPDRKIVIHYSRIGAPAPSKEGAAVLWKKWRLLENRELYDLASDPHQDKNVFADYPDVAETMQRHLDRWWNEVAPRVNEPSSLILGNDADNPSQLSPADWQDSFLDQGKQVRDGLRRNGPWNVVIDRAGEYEVELRRWPRESGAALNASLPPAQHSDGQFPAGVALPIAQARLKVASFDSKVTTQESQTHVTFRASLPAGPTQLQTWFLDEQGQELCGAYYVYVRRL